MVSEICFERIVVHPYSYETLSFTSRLIARTKDLFLEYGYSAVNCESTRQSHLEIIWTQICVSSSHSR
jgi:hypothetical protein